MRPRKGAPSRSCLRTRLLTACCLATTAWPALAQLHSGTYFAAPEASVLECGDRVAGGQRTVPLTAALTFELDATPPALTASISNAVLEGGDPFGLTVRSISGARLDDATYQFSGDYLRDIHPDGSQYLFEWRFSVTPEGQVSWDGMTYWAGGHLWFVTISGILLLENIDQPRLEIVRNGPALTISWPVDYPGFWLEQATELPATTWTRVPGTPTSSAGRLTVTLDVPGSRGFFRLRKDSPGEAKFAVPLRTTGESPSGP